MTFSDLKRGEWCRRRRRGAVWHVVESHIEDRAITRCGHQMEERDRKGHVLDTLYTTPDQKGDLLCLMCDPSLSQKTRTDAVR